MGVFCLFFQATNIKAEQATFLKKPTEISFSSTGSSFVGFNRIGLRTELAYNTDKHRLSGGIMASFLEPVRHFESNIGHEWYDYMPLLYWQSGSLDQTPHKGLPPSNDGDQFNVNVHPGIYINYEYQFLSELNYDISPFVSYKFQYQVDFGPMRSNINEAKDFTTNRLLVYEYEGLFHVIGNFIGIGLEYRPFDRWSFHVSSETGVGISRIYTDHENEEEIEELLNRTFPYSQFDLGVRYQFSE